MKTKQPSFDLFTQPMGNEEQKAYSKGWNDALKFIAERFNQFPFPLEGSDILKSLLPEIPD